MEKYPYDNHVIYNLTVQRHLGFSAVFSRFRTKLHLCIAASIHRDTLWKRSLDTQKWCAYTRPPSDTGSKALGGATRGSRIRALVWLFAFGRAGFGKKMAPGFSHRGPLVCVGVTTGVSRQSKWIKNYRTQWKCRSRSSRWNVKVNYTLQ